MSFSDLRSRLFSIDDDDVTTDDMERFNAEEKAELERIEYWLSHPTTKLFFERLQLTADQFHNAPPTAESASYSLGVINGIRLAEQLREQFDRQVRNGRSE